VRRVVGFVGRVCGGKAFTNENHEFTNGWCANGSRFGLGGLVPAAVVGFGGRVGTRGKGQRARALLYNYRHREGVYLC
jgi:hypothetical protein